MWSRRCGNTGLPCASSSWNPGRGQEQVHHGRIRSKSKPILQEAIEFVIYVLLAVLIDLHARGFDARKHRVVGKCMFVGRTLSGTVDLFIEKGSRVDGVVTGIARIQLVCP